MNMKSIRYICKNTKYPSLADKITKICRERGAVVIQTENKPYFKFDDCTESAVFFDNSTDDELLKRLFVDIFGETNGTDEDKSSYNAYHYTYGNPNDVFSHLFIKRDK